MTALSAAKKLDMRGAPTSRLKYLMTASAVIYEGGLVMKVAAGTVQAAAAGDVTDRVVGIAAETKTAGASVPEWIEVITGLFWLTGTTLGQDDVLKPVFVVDDATIEETPPALTIPAGLMVEYSSATKALVLVEPNMAIGKPVMGRHSLGTIAASTLADGNLDTGWVPGFYGRILGFEARAVVAASTASKTTTLNAEIGGVNVTGGTLALTTAGLDTIGDRMVSTAWATAANVFVPASVIDVECASTTAFVEGSFEIAMVYEQFIF